MKLSIAGKEESMRSNISYIIAKLETIHEDVSLLKTQVDDLRHIDTGKKAGLKIILGALAILGATVGWLVDHAAVVAHHIATT